MDKLINLFKENPLSSIEWNKINWAYLNSTQVGFKYLPWAFLFFGIYLILGIVFIIIIKKKTKSIGPIYKALKKFTLINIGIIILTIPVLILRSEGITIIGNRIFIIFMLIILLYNLVRTIFYLLRFGKKDLEDFHAMQLREKYRPKGK